MSEARSLLWFARHEARLGWRDTLSMMTAGRPDRERRVIFWILSFALFLHGIAYLVLQRYVGPNIHVDAKTLIAVTSAILLSGSAMLSQAMESITRIFYSRSDLELILSAPAKADKLFAVRIGAMALSATLVSVFLIGPFIDILIWRSSLRWIGAYGLLIAVSLVMTSVAIILTVKLFQIIGPRRTRLVAQIIAAIVGGIFIIGLQVAAMFSGGTFSRMTFLESDFVVNNVPDGESLFWWPARAALGDWHCLAWVFGAAFLLFLAVTIRYAPRFAGYVFAATAVSHKPRVQTAADRRFRLGTPSAVLRRKERLLIFRDSWLISQSLMQLLYLVPPALLLWRNYGKGGVAVVLLPVLIMSAGQLAGGLAWLTISGEDAPDLVRSAPVAPKQLLRAKMEAVMQCVGAIFCPFILVLALSSGRQALVAAAGIAAAALSSIAIQLWFRTQAKRTQFRRRHTSSRIATLAETLVSISWAGAGGAAVSGSPLSLLATLSALVLLWYVWRLSPARLQTA